MGRARRRQELTVAMNGIDVGRWTRTAQREESFAYSDSWLANDGAIPISLSMPLSSDAFTGAVVRHWFDNLLPDNAEVRRRVQARFDTDSDQPFDLLSSIGRDCVGALQIYPSDTDPSDVRTVQADPIDDAEVAETLRGTGDSPLGMGREGAFRISIAGAQEKTALLHHQGRWCRPRGATPTSHILKRPIGPAGQRIDMSDSVENEWICLKICEAFGLETASADIGCFEDEKALIVERFDRQWSADRSWLMRLHQEDFCQALRVAPAQKYEEDGGPGILACFDLLRQTLDPEEERRTLFRALVVFWLLAAIDGHAKNFSLFLLPAGRSRVTPVYDVLSAYPVVANGQLHARELEMAMAVISKNRHYKWNRILPRHWLSTAKAVGLPVADARSVLGDVVDRSGAALEEVGAMLPAGFPEAVAGPILKGVAEACDRLNRWFGPS